MLSVRYKAFMLCVVMLNVIMLSVVASLQNALSQFIVERHNLSLSNTKRLIEGIIFYNVVIVKIMYCCDLCVALENTFCFFKQKFLV
jgi:hypothetical protein